MNREWLKPPQADRWATALFCAIAAFAVGQAVQVANGNVHPESIKWLTIACLATFVGVVLPTLGIIEWAGEQLVVLVLGLGVAYQFNQLLSAPPGIYLRANLVVPSDFHVGLGIAALLVGAGLAKKPWLGRFHLWALLAAFLFLGHWLLKASPAPFIDVFVFQRDGVHALLAGNNPYALRYPDIYGNSPFYGEGLSVNGVLQFGYPYFPLSLLLALPGQVLLGDYRYAQLAAMALSAVFIAKARPGRVGIAAASLLLFTPRVFFVLEQGWTDPFVLLGLSAVVFVAIRWKPALPWVLGLTLAVKQYTVFMVPAAWQLLPRPVDARFLAKVVGIAAVVTLPFFFWGPKDFWHDVVALQVLQPFRTDALSYLAWSGQGGGTPWPTSLAFVAAVTGVVLGLWRQARTPAGFAATCALSYLGFFAFNKQAFCNYYYFTLGALLVVVGSVAPDEPAEP
ncbi:MAG: hypothetical protein IPJ65_43120 [Archangiaceae bacterium]|nr:hypothetical protein [Archangiaceae bacterium]